MTDDVILELRGGVYDGSELCVPPEVVARCPACQVRHDLSLALPPRVVDCRHDAMPTAVIPLRLPQTGELAVRYRWLEELKGERRVLYGYHDTTVVVDSHEFEGAH